MGAADPFRMRFGQAEEPHLPQRHQPGHRADGLLDRHGGIDAVLVIQVDHVNAQPLQARVAGLDDILRPSVDPVRLARPLRLPELRRQHDAIAPALQRAAKDFLVVAPAVHVGAIEMIDALVDRVADQILRHCIVRRAVDARQRHAAQPDG